MSPRSGFLTVIVGLIGYAWFPPPLPSAGLSQLLAGFVVISATFSWLVGRRYEVEAELRSSEARLTQAQELAHVGSWQWDTARERLSWSDELYRIFGVDRSSFQPTFGRFLQLVHPDDRPIIENALRQVVAEGTSRTTSNIG